MRIKITSQTSRPTFFPFNYQHVLQAVVYGMIHNSSSEYAEFLHEKGYVRDGIDKIFKFFTFSKLGFIPHIPGKGGFQKIRQIQLIFSTSTEQSFRHLVLGMFSKGTLQFRLSGQQASFSIIKAEVLDDPLFSAKEKFTCLSPITAATKTETAPGRLNSHFLNYMVPEERPQFVENLKTNLIRKFETLYQTPYAPSRDVPFHFHFDLDYITRKNGRISKLIEFKNGIKIKAMEAPFVVEADPELIRIGYECGWGEKNSAGFGCVKSLGAVPLGAV